MFKVWLWLDDTKPEVVLEQWLNKLSVNFVSQFEEGGRITKMSTALEAFAFRVINLEKLPGWDSDLQPSVRRAAQHSITLNPFHKHAIQQFHSIHLPSARPNQINTSGWKWLSNISWIKSIWQTNVKTVRWASNVYFVFLGMKATKTKSGC